MTHSHPHGHDDHDHEPLPDLPCGGCGQPIPGQDPITKRRRPANKRYCSHRCASLQQARASRQNLYLERYRTRLTEQPNCVICQQKATWTLDAGNLCDTCAHGIKQFAADPDRLVRAVAYLTGTLPVR